MKRLILYHDTMVRNEVVLHFIVDLALVNECDEFCKNSARTGCLGR